ncbi:unnamed protein product [Cuscuta epithymum]|uniref:HTH myb-type domain-containing protein n=1 Tax=Cuscuta epithymum TaxID=186058 RepID=A0AAV0FPF2_9ASTE|nr:unnamed protein product [Cuscuta epithymum]
MKKNHLLLPGNHSKLGDEVSEPNCTTVPDIHNVSFSESVKDLQPDDGSHNLSDFLYKFTEQSPRLSPTPSLKFSSFSPEAHFHQPQNNFSRASTFCTSLHFSSSSSLETTLRLGSLPFLPNPSPRRLPNFSIKPSDSPSHVHSVKGPSEDSLKVLQNIPADSLDGADCGYCGFNDLQLTEQMELQLLSDELHIAIGCDGENPRIDEIYEEPQSFSQQSNELTPSQNDISSTLPPDKLSAQPSAGSHKPRMRWTPELHECFMEAVKRLDGPEKATPKAVLQLMKVEGLTIYHVKSHLQKYRLAKYMPERREDKNSSTGDNEATVISKARGKGNTQVLEALRMQMEVQKKLHEQLEVQRALQSRIEEHARYLEKIFEEQQKTGCCAGASQTSSCTDPVCASSPASISPSLALFPATDSGCLASSKLETEDGGAIIEHETPQKRPRTKEVLLDDDSEN